ncbi:hypothetical protein [Amycolatopsis sp. CA-230715]|uniref:hypothetical protein n=1 Tax=Amycolatopsis sp. CA-230715 TaxID=2745196 RepID=UPI001C00E60D|nr:hypothetical protein [Amycolatopsis sp. CA-230715]QWF78947.1 hypothetical protein HUW46_02347 [Amycolatopsis sp. CA-230715]
MRNASRLLTAVLLAIGLAVPACGSADAPDPKPNLLAEYWDSAAVKNDRMPGYGAAPEDRKANLAAYYSAEELVSRLMSPFPCTARRDTGSRGGNSFDTSCDLGDAVRDAVRTAGGDPGAVVGRVALVKHPNGALELLTLFVAKGKVIDGNGGTYAGLDEFRAGNDILSSGDVMLVPRDLTKETGESELITVYGHTRPPVWPWLLGGAGALVLVAALLLIRRARRPGEPEPQPPAAP